MKVSIEGHRQGHFLTLVFPGFVCFVLRPRYQVSVYRTIGPLVFNLIFFILAGIEDMHKSLDEFEFRLICNRDTALN